MPHWTAANGRPLVSCACPWPASTSRVWRPASRQLWCRSGGVLTELLAAILVAAFAGFASLTATTVFAAVGFLPAGALLAARIWILPFLITAIFLPGSADASVNDLAAASLGPAALAAASFGNSSDASATFISGSLASAAFAEPGLDASLVPFPLAPFFGDPHRRGLRHADFDRRDARATRVLRQQRFFRPGVDAGPALGGMAGDVAHVCLRFIRQLAAPRHPVLHAPGAGIIGSRGETDVAELLQQLAQELGRHRKRMQRIEWILQTVGARDARHELRDALRAGRAHHMGFEAAFLLDQVGEKRYRKIVLGGDDSGVAAQRVPAGLVPGGLSRQHDDRLGRPLR